MSSRTNSNTPVNGADTGQAGQETLPPVTVSMKKLTAGVTTMFMGIVQMLEALEPQMAKRLVDMAIQRSTVADAGDAGPAETPDMGSAADADTVDPENKGARKEGENVEAETTDTGVPVSAAPDDSVPADGAAEVPEVKQGNTSPTTATTSSTVSEDDITKIIVRKIKQDRSNNEKIGAILRTYGAAKVSDLPAAKYEAFLTDVSQL